MRFRENRILACFIALVVVLVTILASGGGRVGRPTRRGGRAFLSRKKWQRPMLHSDINARLDAACNLITVAGRYMQSGERRSRP